MTQRPLNKIALLMFALLISNLELACSHPDKNLIKAEDVKANSPPKDKVALGSFQELKGTPYLMAAINNSEWRSDKFASSGSYSTGGQIRNLVFLDTNSLESQRLFDSNAYVILQTDQYTQTIKSKTVTQWLVHQVLKSDTDDNKQLDRSDLITLGVSSASGKRYVEVLTGLSDILGLTMITPGNLVVVYGKNGTKSASSIDLEKRNIKATQPIVNLGL